MNFQTEPKSNHLFSSTIENPKLLNTSTFNHQQSQTLSRIKMHHRNTIRAKQHQKIKAQIRKNNQISKCIQQILTTPVPKQQQDARNWALQLARLLQQTTSLKLDAHQLRDIFTVAQRFPNQGTLTLFLLSIQNSNANDVITLKDLDIWKFLHNILKYSDQSNMKKVKGGIGFDEVSYSPASNRTRQQDIQTQKPNKLQIKLKQLAIKTFINLYKKHTTFRDYSIMIHQTYSNYVVPAFKKYPISLKKDLLQFMLGVFNQRPKQYNKQYIRLIQFSIQLFFSYKVKFQRFFINNKQWFQTQQTMIQALQNSSLVMQLMRMLSDFGNQKWIREILTGRMMTESFGVLNVVYQFVQFGWCIIKNTCRDKGIFNQNSQLFYKALLMLTNTYLLFQSYMDESIDDGLQNRDIIPSIIKKDIMILDLIKFGHENKYFIQPNNDNIKILQHCKQTLFFVLGNQFKQNLNAYQSYNKPFIFLKLKNGQQIRFIQLLYFYINNQMYSHTVKQIIHAAFQFLTIKIQPGDILLFEGVKQILQKLIDMICDPFVKTQIKQFICALTISYFWERLENLGFYIGFGRILQNRKQDLQRVLYSQQCSNQEFFSKLQVVIKKQY